MNLKDLIDNGAFVSEPQVKRQIAWHNTNGVEQVMDIWVRKASYHTITNTWKAAEGNQEHLAARIATMVCDENGSPVLSVADVLGTTGVTGRGPMCDTLFLALITAVNEVNGLAPDQGKKTARKTSGSN